MGRFINADALVSTGQGVFGNNMFAYCGNNPAMRIDETGAFWLELVVIIATICDLYQLTEKGEDEITVAYTEDQESVQITNSDKITTPWVQLGYCNYLNYVSRDYRDYFRGSSVGMTYEWTLHNVGEKFFEACAFVADAAGYDSTELQWYSDRCKDVDLGPTIYHDDAEAHGAFSHLMKGSYFVCNPGAAAYDWICYKLE